MQSHGCTSFYTTGVTTAANTGVVAHGVTFQDLLNGPFPGVGLDASGDVGAVIRGSGTTFPDGSKPTV